MTALKPVSLDDKYALDRGRVYMTGIQALVRVPMAQRQRDAAQRGRPQRDHRHRPVLQRATRRIQLAEEEQRAAQRKGKVSKKKQVDIRVASKMAMHNRFAAKNERQWTVQDESSWNLRQG